MTATRPHLLPTPALLGVLLLGSVHARVPQSHAADCRQLPPSSAPPAAPNDNRTPAGTMREGVLTLHLVAQPVTWYPEDERGCGIPVFGFAEAGKVAQIPAPLIRVPVGTELKITVRNGLDVPFVVRGLEDRAGVADTLQSFPIAAGDSQAVAFRVTTPGTYYYFARPPTPGRFVPANQFGQLVGAFVVDSANPGEPDRILMATRWRGPQGFELLAFNGRSWPYTERFVTTVGDTLRWRVIAGNNDGHAMHLHGTYFMVESKGDVLRDTIYAPARRRTVVTEAMGPGTTMTLRWAPEHAGNWIFHCHLVRHMAASQRLDRLPGAQPAESMLDLAHGSDAMHELAGLVIGISVEPARGNTTPVRTARSRLLRLFADERDSVFGGQPGFGFVLQRGARPPAPDSVRIPGSALVLTRGEPVSITVTNRMRRSLAVHWHGIELESYFDGVAGWSGATGRIAPPITPGGSFVVRFTPPRAGTFIYHVHNEQGEELPSGLYGPLIVIEPGEPYDSAHDLVFVIAEPGPGNRPGNRPGTERPPFVNGSTAPTLQELVAGETYRLRFVTISASDAYQVELRRGAALEEWTPVARDGAILPADFQRQGPAQLRSADPGTTFDYEFTAGTPGDVTLEVDPLSSLNGRPLGTPTTVPIRVRPH